MNGSFFTWIQCIITNNIKHNMKNRSYVIATFFQKKKKNHEQMILSLLYNVSCDDDEWLFVRILDRPVGRSSFVICHMGPYLIYSALSPAFVVTVMIMDEARPRRTAATWTDNLKLRCALRLRFSTNSKLVFPMYNGTNRDRVNSAIEMYVRQIKMCHLNIFILWVLNLNAACYKINTLDRIKRNGDG